MASEGHYRHMKVKRYFVTSSGLQIELQTLEKGYTAEKSSRPMNECATCLQLLARLSVVQKNTLVTVCVRFLC